MEQLFGKYIVEKKSPDYILETILLLLIIILVSIGFLFNMENKPEKISEQLLPVNNYILVNPPNLISLSNQIETIIYQECDLSLIYLFSINDTYYPNMVIRNDNSYSMSSNKKPNILNNSKAVYTTKPKNFTASNTDLLSKKNNTATKIIYHALVQEFKNDLPRWSANINYSNLTINFDNTVFSSGGATLDQQYQSILTEFCPRYITILNKYAHIIKTISIEGHSSSEWQTSSSPDNAYINNMLLSQQRSNAVLEYCLRLPTIKPYKNWLYEILITSGLSSSDLITDSEMEDTQHSRRVEFKIYMRN